ncbi:MAG: hypothetical protein NT027_08930 [Proteobacteria bacterium]|nr:hypothetical protein [Pseudomonadota bacterium]
MGNPYHSVFTKSLFAQPSFLIAVFALAGNACAENNTKFSEALRLAGKGILASGALESDVELDQYDAGTQRIYTIKRK